jgi:ribose/xylose/arabinose/galactoside ABC-type transport system permease subunit
MHQESKTIVIQEAGKVGKGRPRLTAARIVPIALFIGIILSLGLTVDNFFTVNNGINILMQSAALGFMAIGMTAVLITGGMDLSIPAVMALGGILGSMYMRSGGDPVSGALIMIVVGVAAGAFNGYAVAYLKMIPFVVTLSTQAIAMGACVMITNSQSILGLHESFIDVVMSKVWIVPTPVLALAVAAAIVALLSKKSLFGRWLYAVGINAEAARVSGIPKKKVLMGTYMFAGLFAGLAAIIVTARLMSASPTMGQEGVVLNVMGSAVVGGVSIYGGSGSFVGAVIGAVVITLISNIMNMAHLSYYATLIVKGLVIVVVVAIDSRSKGK